jgi:hypothetical protein
MDASATEALVDWLMDGARSTPLAQEVLSEICQRKTASGLQTAFRLPDESSGAPS